ncbi:hypothetical protein [Orrella sp. 11846]|uniref:hypothetical protein n=1 Tax=Orrella sp. 11846 TaxID=3409913 RepID=UPI003B5CD4AF
MTPPITQTSKNIHSDVTWLATTEGVRKIPIPTTNPTMMVMASNTESTGWGVTREDFVIRLFSFFVRSEALEHEVHRVICGFYGSTCQSRLFLRESYYPVLR